MPLYEYQCNSCGHRFEKIVKFSDAPLRVCPKCGKEEIEQLISAPAVQFKGAGWYVTDYARKNSNAPSSAGSENKVDASASESKSDSTKSETKSESKSDNSSSSKSDSSSKSSSTDSKKS